jgi:hypothetical protein
VSRQIDFPRARSTVLIIATVTLIVALAGLLAKIGADAQWLAALGHVIAVRHVIPAGVPFAAAPTGHWPNALVLAELVFNGLEGTLGDRGLMLAQLLAVGAAMTVLSRDARAAGGSSRATSGVLLVAALGTLPSLAIARVQMFSLVLFPVLVMLLRAEARNPSRRIWLVLPLLALWSNLHGAALLGLAVVLAYVLLVRLRQQPMTAVSVAIASPLALCLTPALGGTVSYYHGLLTNVAAQRGQGMWGPLSLHAPLDIVLLLAALALAVRVWRARPQLWEWAVLAALTLATIEASRNGVWLLFFLVPPAARAARAARTATAPTAATPPRTWEGLVPLAALASTVLIVFTIVRGPTAQVATKALVAQAIDLAHGSPVLAADGVDEQVALQGGRIWVGNPIDAFSKPEQAAYLDFLQGSAGGRQALAAQVRVVLVSRGSRTQALMNATPKFALVATDRRAAIYERMPIVLAAKP